MANRIYVDTTRFHIRRNHTDWLALFELAHIPNWDNRCDWYFPRSLIHSCKENARFVVNHCYAKAKQHGWALPRLSNPYEGSLNWHELFASKCNVVYSHSGYPVNTHGIPVVWRNTILDPQMQKNWGSSDIDLRREAQLKEPLFAQSRLVHVSTRSEVSRLGAQFPALRSRFRYMPYFLPYLDMTTTDELAAKKQRTNLVKVVYVGRYGYRKGLDLFVQAAKMLELGSRRDLEMHIVCAAPSEWVEMPAWPNLVHYTTLGRKQTLQLMAESQIFVMPSRFESYGIVFIEAMGYGLVPVVPDWEVQREIVDHGKAGMVVGLSADAIATAIDRLATDNELRIGLARNALERFKCEYHPAVVAQRFNDVMIEAAENL
jgi:glycosyltransferase involved in cell wall biosynthesis